ARTLTGARQAHVRDGRLDQAVALVRAADRAGDRAEASLLVAELHFLRPVFLARVGEFGDGELRLRLHHDDGAVAHLDLRHAGLGRRDGVADADRRALGRGAIAAPGERDPHVARDELEDAGGARECTTRRCAQDAPEKDECEAVCTHETPPSKWPIVPQQIGSCQPIPAPVPNPTAYCVSKYRAGRAYRKSRRKTSAVSVRSYS